MQLKSESEGKFQFSNLADIINFQPDATLVIDLEGRVIAWNRAMETLTGIRADDMLGKGDYEYALPFYGERRPLLANLVLEPAAKLKDYYPSAKQENGTLVVEPFVPGLRPGGAYLWAKAAPLFGPDGQIAGAIETMRDTTERQRDADRLRNSETRYRELSDNMSSGVVVYQANEDGSDFIFLDFNRAAEHIENIKKEDILGRSVLEVFPGVKEFGLFEVLQRVWHSGQPEHFPVRLYHDQRIQGWRENYVYKLPSGEVVAVYDDVTGQKQAEEALRQQGAYLAALHETTLGLITRQKLEDLLRDIVSRAAHLLGSDHGFIYLVEPQGSYLEVKLGIGIYVDYVGLRLKSGEGLSGKVWLSKQPQVVDDYTTWDGRSARLGGAPFRAIAAAPLISGDEVSGVIGVGRTEPGQTFDATEVDILAKFARLVSIALENARLYEVQQQELAERRRVEESLRQSQARYQGLFEDSPISLWEEDFSEVKRYIERLKQQGESDLQAYLDLHPEVVRECMLLIRILRVNNAALAIHQAKDFEHLLQLREEIIFGPESPAHFKKQLVYIANGQIKHSVDGVIYRPSGERMDVQFHWSAAPGYEKTLERVMLSIVDISEIKRAERALRESRDLLQLVIDNIPLAVLWKDRNSVYMGCNIIQANFTGIEDPQEVIGKTDYDLAPFRTDADHFVADDREVMENDTPILHRINTLNLLDGRTLVIDGSKMPLHDADGHVTGVLGVWEDITERKKLEDSLLATQKLADLGTLAAGIAHEINSPLQVITGASESLLRQIEKNGGQPPADFMATLKHYLEMMHRNGWRVAEIVRSLSTYARTSPNRFEPYELNAILQDGLLLISHQLRNWSNIEVITEFGSDMPPLHCDRNQVIQILINLLTNARDAMPEGGKVTLRTRYEPAERRLVMQVSDTGPEIPEEVRHKIFDPFFTTKPLGVGTGLGLAIVMGIVKSHGGDIQLESSPENGATFNISFPEILPTEDIITSPDDQPGRYGDAIR